MLALLLLALYGLSASGHFPQEFRAAELTGGTGAAILWGTMLVAAAAMFVTFLLAWRALPWFAVAIGGGMILLMTPLLLQPLPDRFVNGRASLLVFSGSAALAAAIAWWAVG